MVYDLKSNDSGALTGMSMEGFYTRRTFRLQQDLDRIVYNTYGARVPAQRRKGGCTGLKPARILILALALVLVSSLAGCSTLQGVPQAGTATPSRDLSATPTRSAAATKLPTVAAVATTEGFAPVPPGKHRPVWRVGTASRGPHATRSGRRAHADHEPARGPNCHNHCPASGDSDGGSKANHYA